MSSFFGGKEYARLYLYSHFPKSSTCLDVGCCEGQWNDLLSDWFIMDGIEVWEPNVTKYRLYERYRNLFTKNIVDFEYPYHYDVVVFGDILEHLTVEEAQKVLAKAKDNATEVLVAVPFLYEQGEKDGNKYEIHKQSDLTEALFTERYPGFTQIWPNTQSIVLPTPLQYAYYKRSDTPYFIDDMQYFTSREILDITMKGEPRTSTDYLNLMRGCLDALLMAKVCEEALPEAANRLYPYFKIVADKILEGVIPTSLRFWKDYYTIISNYNKAPISNEEKQVAIRYRLEAAQRHFKLPHDLQWSKWAFDLETNVQNLGLEYAIAAADVYYTDGKAIAKQYNDIALSLEPKLQLALDNAKFYE